MITYLSDTMCEDTQSQHNTLSELDMTNSLWGGDRSSELFVLGFRQCVRKLVQSCAPLPSVSWREKHKLIFSLHHTGWDCASYKNKVIWWLSWKQACFCVTQGWGVWNADPCGAPVSLFLLKTHSKASISYLAAQICSWGSFSYKFPSAYFG